MEKLTFKPLEDRVIIKPYSGEQVRESGLFIPDTAKEKPQEGRVVAVGPGKTTKSGEVINLSLEVGDIVLYPKYSGIELKIEGSEYLIVKESEVFAKKQES